MELTELPFEYWNELAKQMLFTSALLSAFSVGIVANLIVFNSEKRLIRIILKVATMAASCFLISLFAIQKIVMQTSDSYPFKVESSDIFIPRIIGGGLFLLGILGLCTIIALSGYTKSKKTGIFTSIIGTLTFIAIFFVI